MIYKEFDSVINQLSCDDKTTISSVFSLISYLKHHLNKLSFNQNENISFESKLLLKELDKRFDHFFNPKNRNFFDTIYLVSAYLDPRF